MIVYGYPLTSLRQIYKDAQDMQWMEFIKPTTLKNIHGYRRSLLFYNLNRFSAYSHGLEKTWILRLAPGWTPNGQWRHPYTMARLFGALCFAHDKQEVLDISPLCFANVRHHMASREAIAYYAKDLSDLARNGTRLVIDVQPWQGDSALVRTVVQRVVGTIQDVHHHASLFLQVNGYIASRSVLSTVSRFPEIQGILVDVTRGVSIHKDRNLYRE